jgi:hypothetical protein
VYVFVIIKHVKTNNKTFQDVHTVEYILDQRRQRVQSVCARIGIVSNKTSELSGVLSANLSYCAVQKAGCTMWIRLFKFMAGQNRETGNPMTLTKDLIHNHATGFYKTFRRTGNEDRLAHSVRTMTVRNPYTRLWSAYIDKFLLPDFWFSKGKHIIRMVRKNPQTFSKDCGHDVTFPEFIEYVITIGHKFDYWNQDKHWLPSSDICDPCVFKPSIIGKQETFLQDLKYTLKTVRLDYLLPNITSIDHIEYEIKDAIDYNFKIFPRVKNCIDTYELCKRIWTAFILNGYLPSEEPFPTNIYHDSLNSDSFYELVKSVRSKYNTTHANAKERRKHALITAYKQINETKINELKKLYKMDFELFDYKSELEIM